MSRSRILLYLRPVEVERKIEKSGHTSCELRWRTSAENSWDRLFVLIAIIIFERTTRVALPE